MEQLNIYIDKVKNDKPNFSKNDFDKCLRLCGITDKNNQTVYPTLAGTIICCLCCNTRKQIR